MDHSSTTTMPGRQDQDLPPPPPPQQQHQRVRQQQKRSSRRQQQQQQQPKQPQPQVSRRTTTLVRTILVFGGCMYILISQLVLSTSQFRTVLLKTLLIETWQANYDNINIIPQQQQEQHHHHQSTTTISTSTATTATTPTPTPQYQSDDPRRRGTGRENKNNERPEQKNNNTEDTANGRDQHNTMNKKTQQQKLSVDDNDDNDDNTTEVKQNKKNNESSPSQTKPEPATAQDLLETPSRSESGSAAAAPRMHQEQEPQPQEARQRHVVFIGDDSILLRNSFMEWLHHRHHHHHHRRHFSGNSSILDDCPLELINENVHGSKQEYIDWSTNYFGSNSGRSVSGSGGSESSESSHLYFNTTSLPTNMGDSDSDNVVNVESIHYRSNSRNSSWYATYINLSGGNDIFNTTFKFKNDSSSNVLKTIVRQISMSTNLHQSQFATIITPTAIVMTCPSLGSSGRRQRVAHPRQIRRILEDAYDATNKQGIVIWRHHSHRNGGMTPPLRTTATTTATATTTTTITTTKDERRNDDDPGAHPSETEIDLEVEKLSHNFPWLIYQQHSPSSEDNIVFQDTNTTSNPAVYYRDWNRQLESVLEPTKKQHRAFILVGGARTMESTIHSYVNNFILPLCPPHMCVGHLVTHLSSSDNRPSAATDDPLGQVVAGHDANIVQYLEQLPVKLHLHPVKGYDIGSVEEQAAMDQIEAATTNTTTRQRIQMLRSADPRRYSMWFARAWTWRTVEELSKLYDFDFFAFTRPDLLWLTSVSTVDFFKKFESEKRNDVWVHDVYFNNVPDTFALFTSMDAARRYFSLEELVRPGVACLGGPTFNDTLVASRLEQSGISTSPMDWCKNVPSPTEDQGWSERILRRKLEKTDLQVRYFSASAVLLRYFERPDNVTVLKAECFALNRFTHIGFAATNANISGSSFVGCAQMAYDADQDFPTSSLANFSLPTYQTFYVQNKERPDECLELFNETLYSRSCDRFAATQMFGGSKRDDVVGLKYSCFKSSNCPLPDSFLIPNNRHNISFGSSGEWEKVPVLLNHIFPYNHWQLKTGRN